VADTGNWDKRRATPRAFSTCFYDTDDGVSVEEGEHQLYVVGGQQLGGEDLTLTVRVFLFHNSTKKYKWCSSGIPFLSLPENNQIY
jgi:hypothetical protein